MLVLIVVLVRRVPSRFIPTEDKGYFGIVVQLPDGASTQRTEQVVSKIEEYLRKQPAVRYVVSFTGLSFVLGTNQTNSASMFVLLKPWDERKSKRISSTRCSTAPMGSWPRSTLRWHSASIFPRSRARHYGWSRSQLAGPRHQRRPEVRRAGERVCAESEYAAGAARRSISDPGQCASGLCPRGPGKGQIARGPSGGCLSDPPGNALDPLHQRLQPVRQDVPGSAGGAVEVPGETGRHRPPLRARAQRCR